MKRLVVFAAGVALMGLTACSSHETKTTVEATPQTSRAENTYIDRAQQQIGDLQARLDSMKPAGAKFQSSRTKHLRGFLNQEYLKLGEAKQTLHEIRNTAGTPSVDLQARLDNTLANIRNDLDRRAAE